MATPSGANAPYKIVKRGEKFVVVNNTGATKASFDTMDEARKYQKALYANVPGAPKRAGKVAFTGKAKDRVKAAWDDMVERVVAKREPITMKVDGEDKYPISDQHSANSAWKLRSHGKGVSEEAVVAHIRRAVKTLGLQMPGGDDRQKSAESSYMLRPHGFVFPGGMPPCAVCGEGPNGGAHVNPPRSQGMSALANNWGVMVRRESAQDQMGPIRTPRRTHVYTSGQAGVLGRIRCAACGQPMSASAHTPGMPVGPAPGTLGAGVDVQQPQTAALDNDPSAGSIVMVRHKFEALEGQSSIGDDYKMCRLCGFPEDDAVHELDEDGKAQLPTVVVKQTASFHTNPVLGPDVTAATDTLPTDVDSRQQAFVTQLGGKVILSAPAAVFTDPDKLPREIAAEWERQSAANPHFMWLRGAYVEAGRPNRNMAVWNADDLEIGEPTVAHGPINMLHAERHIVGTVAAASLVKPEREAAAAGEVNTIHALGAVWKYLFREEARQIAMASEQRKLWYSMECVSREVACLTEGCDHTQSYRDYMLAKHARCQHIKQGGPRRFVDPIFDGAGIIIPPIRPGWAGANASVMRQAAMLAEGHEAQFGELSEHEAIGMVAQIIEYANQGVAA